MRNLNNEVIKAETGAELQELLLSNNTKGFEENLFIIETYFKNKNKKILELDTGNYCLDKEGILKLNINGNIFEISKESLDEIEQVQIKFGTILGKMLK